MRLEVQTLDWYFFAYVGSILLVVFAVFATYNHYKTIGSNEYLLIMFTFVFFAFGWYIPQMYFTYFTVIGGVGDLFPLLIIARPIFFIGLYLLLIHTIRLRDWSDYSKMEKRFIYIINIEYILAWIQDVLALANMWNKNQFSWLTDSSGVTDDIWWLNLTFLAILLPNHYVFHLSRFYLVYGFMIYSYLTVDLASKSAIVKRSRYLWILFAVTRILNMMIDQYIVFDSKFIAENLDQNVLFIGNLVSQFIIMLLIIIYPEALLVTKFELSKANNLYSIVNPINRPLVDRIINLDYKKRMEEYIDSILKD